MFFFDFDIFSIRPATTGRPRASLQRTGRVALDLLGEEPVAGIVAVGLVAHHALGEQPGKRLAHPEIAALGERSGEEARIKEMQHRMLDAADILVHRQPVIDVGAHEGCVGARGEQKRAKYHDDSKNVSNVSVSRSAAPPQPRAVRVLPASDAARADCRDGRSSRPRAEAPADPASGTGTMPQAGQWMTGMGQPQ